MEQTKLFDIPKRPENQLKRNWENAFQRWCNRMSQDEVTAFGKCGYGSMCDYCGGIVSYGRPCVRALNEMCRDKGIIIDYIKRNFEEIW